MIEDNCKEKLFKQTLYIKNFRGNETLGKNSVADFKL